jgi:hypothetical protein
MAEKDMPSFAVDADITPLQGRYFQNVQSRISDPRLRTQAYGLIKQTFGGIQQARDIQRARQQEEEDRALNMDVRRAQLEQGKLELGLAREKFRRQQESAATGASIYTELDRVAKDPNLTPDEKAKGIYGIAAQNPDFFTDNPAATNRLNFTLGAAGLGKGKAPTAMTPAKEASLAEKLINSGASAQALTEAGVDPSSQIVKDLYKKIQADQTAKLAKETIKPYEDAIKSLNTADASEAGDINWGDVDEGLRALDYLGLVDDKTKKDLEDVGVRTFNPGAELPKYNADEFVKLRKKAFRIINSTINKAGVGGAAPAQTSSGINVNSLTQ